MYILQGYNAYKLLTTGARTQVQVFLCSCVKQLEYCGSYFHVHEVIP